ncbi:MAG: polysaccharide deacetylase family protein [Armatimonadota bacterium]|nr:polysaccharide deacetylase family protein [Armatimonadota bacterium]
MASDRLYASWTMDCEPIAEEVATGGPADWELSERAMRGYVAALAARGQRVTLFVIPRVAEVQADVLRELGERGAELAMHMHPQTVDYGIDAHLGELPPESQRELLESGRDRLEAALGAAPRGFRPGCFSASEATFGILVELGFTHGSVSLPGRAMAERAADWVGADPFGHWASATSPLAAGELPFLELPTAVDLRDVAGPEAVPGDARHLRLERPEIEQWGPDLIRRHLARQVAEGRWLKSLVIMTHNTREYGEDDEPARRALEVVADAVEVQAAALGLTVTPATLAEVRESVAEQAPG